MRTLILATAVLTTLAAPAFAQTHHHIVMPAHAADFDALVATMPARSPFAASVDPTSPRLANAPFCVWGVHGDC